MPDGSLAPTPEESAESVMLELEGERKRVDIESQRADTESQRANAESQRANAESDRANKLVAKLRD